MNKGKRLNLTEWICTICAILSVFAASVILFIGHISNGFLLPEETHLFEFAMQIIALEMIFFIACIMIFISLIIFNIFKKTWVDLAITALVFLVIYINSGIIHRAYIELRGNPIRGGVHRDVELNHFLINKGIKLKT